MITLVTRAFERRLRLLLDHPSVRGCSQWAPGLSDLLLIRSPNSLKRIVRFCRVHPPHSGHRHNKEYRCDPSRWAHECAVHWHWQRDADVNAWTPEIYQSTSFPITVTRKVSVQNVHEALARNDTHFLQKCLHFDFKLEVELRELGHRFKDLLSPLDKPPDMRLKRDAGELLRPEYWAFCINCLPGHVGNNWPTYMTRDRRERILEISRKVSEIFLYLDYIALTH